MQLHPCTPLDPPLTRIIINIFNHRHGSTIGSYWQPKYMYRQTPHIFQIDKLWFHNRLVSFLLSIEYSILCYRFHLGNIFFINERLYYSSTTKQVIKIDILLNRHAFPIIGMKFAKNENFRCFYGQINGTN